MGNKLIKIMLFLALIAGMTGIAAAVCSSNGDCLTSDFSGTQIHSQTWDGSNTDNTFYYQIRYYQPGTYDGGLTPGIGEYSASNTDGYFTSDIFEGLPNSPVIDKYFTSPIGFQPGTTWMVALMKDGRYPAPNNNGPIASTEVTSFRVNIPVNIPIPEFPIIAMPIAAVLGLLFYFQQSRSKKE